MILDFAFWNQIFPGYILTSNVWKLPFLHILTIFDSVEISNFFIPLSLPSKLLLQISFLYPLSIFYYFLPLFCFIYYCFCSVVKSYLTFCDAMDCTMSGSSVLQYLLKFAQIHARWVSDAIQPFHRHLLLPSILTSLRVFSNELLFSSGGQRIGASVSTSVLPMNIHGWFPLGLTALISLQSMGLSRVFSSITIRKLQFFGAQPSLWSSSHICIWLLEKS